jgi:hypothetical protein
MSIEHCDNCIHLDTHFFHEPCNKCSFLREDGFRVFTLFQARDPVPVPDTHTQVSPDVPPILFG